MALTGCGGSNSAAPAPIAAPSPTPTATAASLLPFPDRRLWATLVGYGLPDCDDCAGIHYGELYPLNLRESADASAVGDTSIAQMVAAGITAVQRLVLSSQTSDAGAWLKGPLTKADAYPGFMVVPELSIVGGLSSDQGRQTALALVTSYATEARLHRSAGRVGNSLIIATYATRTLAPADWQWVRDQAAAQGIATYWLADVNASFSQQTSFQSAASLFTPYFPVFEASYLFDDQVRYNADLLALMIQYQRPYAGGFMPGYDRQTSATGGYADAGGTSRMRQQLQQGLDAGLTWQTINTWDDVVERTAIWPSSDWNWTRADLAAFYSARQRGAAFPTAGPQLYITTPQYIRLGEAPQAEAMVLNPTGQPLQVKVSLVDGAGQAFGPGSSMVAAAVGANTSGAATTSAAQTVAAFPSGRFLRARAELDDAAGNVLQTVTSAPILVYDVGDPNLALVTYSTTQPLPVRREYYSIPAARALPGMVQLRLSASPVTAAAGSATAIVAPPSGIMPRFVEVLQNARQVKNLYAHAPFSVAVPATAGRIVGNEASAPTAAGFYVARVIDQQERVGYSDPIYVAADGTVLMH